MKILVIIMMVVIVQLTADINSDYTFGKQLFDDNLFDESLDIFDKIITKNPTSFSAEKAIFYSGKAHEKLEDYELAEKMYKKLYEGYPNSLLKEKVLYSYAKSLAFQNKNLKAIQLYTTLIKRYPKNEYAEASLIPLLQAKLKEKQFFEVISLAQSFTTQYKKTDKIPEILLTEAKTNYKINHKKKATVLIDKIIKDYPKTDAFWEAKLIKTTNFDTKKAINSLENILQSDIPRDFEEIYLQALIKIYLNNDYHQEADKELDRIIAKFNNSKDIDIYIIQSQETKDYLKKPAQIIMNYEDQKKYFKESSYKSKFYYYVAKSYYHLNNFEQSLKLLDNIKSDEIQFEVQMLLAKTHFSENNFLKAISTAQKIVNSQPDHPQISSIYLFVGNIYLNKLNKVNQALTNYQLAIANTNIQQNLQKIYFQSALCYEKKQEFSKALSTLQKIDLKNMKDSDFGKQIKDKLEYLTNYKIKNHDAALDKLIASIASFLENDNKILLKKKLTNILIHDLKDFDSGLKIIENQTSYNLIQLTDIYLKQLGKAILENDIRTKNEVTKKLNELVTQNQENKELVDKVKIE
ncbi:MAG: tetratricopeptide repeat protein [Candidatus Cloacimonadota bacterium]|nr:tetratricopeptide repeat protein [Candidatus Cloacimonadota bacterium]